MFGESFFRAALPSSARGLLKHDFSELARQIRALPQTGIGPTWETRGMGMNGAEFNEFRSMSRFFTGMELGASEEAKNILLKSTISGNFLN